MTIERVLETHTPAWMSLPGVVGTGIGSRQGKPCIKILAQARTPELQRAIPSEVDGYPVEIEVTGEFRALPR